MEDDDAENDDEELASMPTEELRITTRALGNDIRVLTDELQRISWEPGTLEEKTEKNQKKIKIRTKLPYIVTPSSRFILKMRLRKMVQMLIRTCNGRENVSY